MSLEDAKQRFVARVSVNAPMLSLSDNTVLLAVAQALLAEAEDVRSAVAALGPKLYVATATGDDLRARAADFGVFAGQGSASSALVVFKAPAPVPSTVTVPAGSVVLTAGDGITTVPQAFATQADAVIPPGATTTASNQQETVTITDRSTITGGTFTLTHAGQTTAPIAYNANAPAVQLALQGLSNVGLNTITGAPNVAVGGVNPNFVVVWQGNLGGRPFGALTGVQSFITSGYPDVVCAISAPVAGTAATNTARSAAGNVAAGSIASFATQVANLAVSNATADGGTAATGGADADSDAQVRSLVAKVVQPRWGTAAVEAAILAVPGVYDAWVYDPAAPGGPGANGTITYYWCDVLGNQTNALYPTMAAQVDAAVAQAIPPGISASSTTFTIVDLTAVAVTYSAPAAVQTSLVAPQIQAAVAAYVQGNGDPRSGLIHNQAPNAFAMGSAVQTGLNPQSAAPLGVSPVVGLTLFTLTSSTPAIGSASNDHIYRLSGSPAAVVSATRV